MNTKTVFIFIIILLFTGVLFSADPPEKRNKRMAKTTKTADAPIVDDNWKYHKIGTLWSRVTNFGKTGDDAYNDRTPSGDWPGGSGNSYLYRGSPWLAARVDGTIHVTMVEDAEYAPIDSVHSIQNGDRAEHETFTKYYDVKTPLATGHFPLGLEVTERTYSWSESFRDDFIIYEFSIKNVGVDSDGDGYPDTPRDLEDFYFTYRMDGDVSKLPDWDAESRFSNQDDLAGVNASWGILDLFPEWIADAGETQQEIEEKLGVPDSTMMFMWDADNPSYPAWDGGQDNDAFNPGIKGNYQTPGFLGFKVLKTVPESFRPNSFHTCHIYNDPSTDQQAYDRMMGPNEFESDGPSGVIIAGGVPFPYDYRAILSVGPLETLKAGDSVVVTCALGIGADSVNAGVRSLIELVNIMNVAQRIVDDDYQVVVQTAPAPGLEVTDILENGITKGLRIRWDKSPEETASFLGYKVWRSAGRTSDYQLKWNPFGLGTYEVDSLSWPPETAADDPGKYELLDMDITKGLDYYYSVQSMSVDPVYGYSESNIQANMQTVVPSNPAANNLDKIKVVPNPYIGSASWNNPRPGSPGLWRHRLQFTNLPTDASIKIFTLDLDFVAEINSGEIAIIDENFNAPVNYGVAEWDLITKNDQEAAPGIYIFVVDSPSAGKKVGKFVIIR
jgi:hypothetical protein